MSLLTYDFSTLYNTLPHDLIKEKLLDFVNLFYITSYCHCHLYDGLSEIKF